MGCEMNSINKFQKLVFSEGNDWCLPFTMKIVSSLIRSNLVFSVEQKLHWAKEFCGGYLLCVGLFDRTYKKRVKYKYSSEKWEKQYMFIKKVEGRYKYVSLCMKNTIKGVVEEVIESKMKPVMSAVSQVRTWESFFYLN